LQRARQKENGQKEKQTNKENIKRIPKMELKNVQDVTKD
jgi:hypothetical protein